MLQAKNVRIVSCEEKDYTLENGKSGKYYPTVIRVSGKLYRITSKEALPVDTDCNLDLEILEKTSKTGFTYTTIRILGETE